MHIICSNFGSIQPESKVAVWSTSAKPAMPGSQAGESSSQGSWMLEGHVGIENEVANMSPKEQLMSSPAHFIDIDTGEPIPNDRCLYVCQEIDRIQKVFQEGRDIYTRVFMDTPGSLDERRAAARKASQAHAGGSYTQIWNRLCHDKICISLVVTGPPANNSNEAYSNERRLLIALYQCDPSLAGLWQDIWTSQQEIGTLSQTFIYVRYPYHMGKMLQKVCQVLSTVSVENHTFSARVTTEGRAKLHHHHAEVQPWQLCINGQKLAALDAEEIAAATKRQPATCEDRFMKVMGQHTYHLGFHKSIAGECQSAITSIWEPDWQQIKDSNKAWRCAQMLASNDELKTMQVYLFISGLVIDAATQGKNQPGPDVFLYTCSAAALYAGDQELFMSTRVGDTIIALDATFKLSFDADGDKSMRDADGGMWAVYGLKYEVDEHKGIEFKKAGISFVQHLTSKTHQNQLHIFSAQVAPHIAKFSANVAVQQARFGEPSSSNNSSSAEMVSPGFYWC